MLSQPLRRTAQQLFQVTKEQMTVIPVRRRVMDLQRKRQYGFAAGRGQPAPYNERAQEDAVVFHPERNLSIGKPRHAGKQHGVFPRRRTQPLHMETPDILHHRGIKIRESVRICRTQAVHPPRLLGQHGVFRMHGVKASQPPRAVIAEPELWPAVHGRRHRPGKRRKKAQAAFLCVPAERGDAKLPRQAVNAARLHEMRKGIPLLPALQVDWMEHISAPFSPIIAQPRPLRQKKQAGPVGSGPLRQGGDIVCFVRSAGRAGAVCGRSTRRPAAKHSRACPARASHHRAARRSRGPDWSRQNGWPAPVVCPF